MKEEFEIEHDLTTFDEVKEYYFNNLTEKQRLKFTMKQTVLKNPEEHSNLFALFILNSEEPFFYMGGATYLEIGKHVEGELFKNVSIHLLRSLENSNDPWCDMQQIGRWVGQDFVPQTSALKLEEKVGLMATKMMDYFEGKYEIKKPITGCEE